MIEILTLKLKKRNLRAVGLVSTAAGVTGRHGDDRVMKIYDLKKKIARSSKNACVCCE